MKKLVTLVLTLAVALLLPAAAYASTEAWDFNAAGTAFTDGNWTFGEVFVPKVDMHVDYLGYYAPNGLGNYLGTHPVGLFDATGFLMAQTVIDNNCNATTSSGHFCFNPITAVTLFKGQTYVIEGVSDIDNYTWNDPGFTVYAPITIQGNNWVLGNGLNFNGTFLINDVTDGYWGPNFGYYTTPEPGTLLLLGSGFAGLAGLLRRKLNF